jgi:hypothetical protein
VRRRLPARAQLLGGQLRPGLTAARPRTTLGL